MTYERKGMFFKTEKQLMKTLVKSLSKSEMWVVLRQDQKGIHIHTPDMDHMALLGVFLAQNPEILKQINEFAQLELIKETLEK